MAHADRMMWTDKDGKPREDCPHCGSLPQCGCEPSLEGSVYDSKDSESTSRASDEAGRAGTCTLSDIQQEPSSSRSQTSTHSEVDTPIMYRPTLVEPELQGPQEGHRMGPIQVAPGLSQIARDRGYGTASSKRGPERSGPPNLAALREGERSSREDRLYRRASRSLRERSPLPPSPLREVMFFDDGDEEEQETGAGEAGSGVREGKKPAR